MLLGDGESRYCLHAETVLKLVAEKDFLCRVVSGFRICRYAIESMEKALLIGVWDELSGLI